MGRIEKASMGRRGAGARTAMEKDDRSTQRIARDFPIHRVDVVELEHAALMRLDLRIELANRRGRYALGTHGSGLDPRALQHGVSSTLQPAPRSSGVAFSISLWLRPFSQGTK